MSSEGNIFQIEIPKRSSTCMEGQEPLIAGMEYYSILVPLEQGSYQRHDFCLTCWESKAKERYLITGKTGWKAKVASKVEVEDLSKKTRDEKAFVLLKEAIQTSNAEDWAETFVLALYLARRRILYLRQELPQTDGSTLCVYEVAATEEMLSIQRRSLTHVNIQEIQEKIAQRLKK